MELQFDWDDEKAAENLRKHGVTFPEASQVFDDRLSVTISDPLHSDDEDRMVIIGESRLHRVLVVCHTFEGRVIRIFSARRATSKERRHYMNREYDEIRDDDMLPEYDFSKGVRGKYYDPNIAFAVHIEKDVAEFFTTGHEVNEGLRILIREGRVPQASRHD